MSTSDVVAAELLTTRQVAEMLNVGERSIWRWSHTGRMPRSVRVGDNAVRFRRRDIEEWIAHGCPRVDGEVRHGL